MARTSTKDYSVRHGKMNKKDDVVYRTRNGIQHSYTLSKNSVPPSKAQVAHRKFFGKVTAIVNAIMSDPEQVAEWNAKRLAYNKSVALDMTAKRYKTTRSYVHASISALLANKAPTRRKKGAATPSLPRGLRLHIRPFADLSTTELYEILKARFIVFYSEQNCRYLDMDDIDYTSTHIALHRKGRVIGYARLFEGSTPGEFIIGRMLTIERGKGYGRYIMDQAMLEAKRQGASSLLIHAQTHAVTFYESFGFTTVGDIFMEADIPHICMKKAL